MKKRKLDEGEVEEAPTASERTLAANASSETMESGSSPMHKDSRHGLEGFYVISEHQLTAALQNAHVCPGGEFCLKMQCLDVPYDVLLCIFSMEFDIITCFEVIDHGMA